MNADWRRGSVGCQGLRLRTGAHRQLALDHQYLDVHPGVRVAQSVVAHHGGDRVQHALTQQSSHGRHAGALVHGRRGQPGAGVLIDRQGGVQLGAARAQGL